MYKHTETITTVIIKCRAKLFAHISRMNVSGLTKWIFDIVFTSKLCRPAKIKRHHRRQWRPENLLRKKYKPITRIYIIGTVQTHWNHPRKHGSISKQRTVTSRGSLRRRTWTDVRMEKFWEDKMRWAVTTENNIFGFKTLSLEGNIRK